MRICGNLFLYIFVKNIQEHIGIKSMKTLQILLALIFFALATPHKTKAQEKIKITQNDYANQEIEMADAMRADGKIYVVIAVILTVLGGMFVYLFILDKKISELEKMTKNNN